MDRKTLLIGIGSFLFLLAVGAAVFVFAKPASFRGTTFAEPYPVASEIDLTRSDGSRFRLSELRGDVVLVFFGYTACPDVCPTTMAELRQALSKLNAQDVERVKVVFVTVDPDRDPLLRPFDLRADLDRVRLVFESPQALRDVVRREIEAVSYTHLTLPTIYSV